MTEQTANEMRHLIGGIVATFSRERFPALYEACQAILSKADQEDREGSRWCNIREVVRRPGEITGEYSHETKRIKHGMAFVLEAVELHSPNAAILKNVSDERDELLEENEALKEQIATIEDANQDQIDKDRLRSE
jgi:hypothetical protein